MVSQVSSTQHLISFRLGLFRGRLSVFRQLNSDTWTRRLMGSRQRANADSSCSSFRQGLPTRRSHGWNPPIKPPGRWMRLSLPDEHRACVRVCFFPCTCRCFRCCCSSRAVGLRFFSTDFLSLETLVLPEIF
jgi:hypothetical protein